MVIDPSTGKKANFGSKKTIIEAYKKMTHSFLRFHCHYFRKLIFIGNVALFGIKSLSEV